MINKDDWEIKKLGEVYDVRDGTHDSPRYVDNGYALITSKNLKADSISFDNLNYITEHDYVNINKRSKVDIGDVLFAMIGTIGNPVVIKNEVNFAIKNVALFKVPECQNSFFLKYFLSSKVVIESMTKNTKGATQKFVGLNYLRNFLIPIPPLPIQQQIVSELDTLNEIITKKKQHLAELDNLAQATFYDMFGDPVTNEKGWEVKELSKLVSKLGDGIHGTPKYASEGEYWFVNGNNLKGGTIKLNSNTKRVDAVEYEKHKVELNENSIIISINGTLGNIAFYNGEKIMLGKSACYFNIIEAVNKSFIYYIFKSSYFIEYAKNEATGTTIQNVSLKSMRKFPIPVPPIELQTQFADKINAIEKQKELIKKSINDTQLLFDYTMDKYFN